MNTDLIIGDTIFGRSTIQNVVYRGSTIMGEAIQDETAIQSGPDLMIHENELPDYLDKPFTDVKLLEVMEKYMKSTKRSPQ